MLHVYHDNHVPLQAGPMQLHYWGALCPCSIFVLSYMYPFWHDALEMQLLRGAAYRWMSVSMLHAFGI